jgi:uncharacterized repeat protein (TIGR01451 family)
VQLVVKVNANRTSDITNTATVSSATTDPTPGNDSATQDTTVGVSADLSITKTDSPDPVTAGTDLTYTITVSNAGPSDALGVSVSDTLPTQVTYGAASPSQGTCSQAGGTVTCNLGTIAASGSASITVTVTPTAAAGAAGSISNSASVSSSTTDPVAGNNTATQDTAVGTSADLSITKTDSADPITAGTDLTYTITASNAGPSTASAVQVTDTMPVGVDFVSATPSQGTCSFAAGTLTCPLGSLAAGANATVTLVVHVHASRTTDLSNTATVSSSTTDPVPGNNTTTQGTTMSTSADLSITKTDAPDPATVGQNVTYTLTVSNAGPGTATSVAVTDPLPAGLTFVSASPSQGTCAQAAGTVTCALGDLAPSGTATVTIVVTATAAGTITNTASVQSAVNDPDPTDNSASQPTTVSASADLSITKSSSPDPVTVGQKVTYTLAVANAGPSAATGVQVTDTLPTGLTFVSASSTQGTCTQSGGVITCDIGGLASGGTATVTLVARATAAGVVTNTARVTATTPDPDPSDNSGSDDVTVVASADLSIAKSASPDPVVAGNELTYSITVSNAGPSDASNVVVTDPLPSGVTFVSADHGGTASSGTVTWSLGSLASGSSVTLSLVVTVDETTEGTLANTATVDSDTADPDPGDDSDSVDVTVDPPDTPVADLSIEKTADNDKPKVGSTVTYTIALTNKGPADATGVVVADVLPSGLEFGSATATQGEYDEATGDWDVGDLAVGDEATLTMDVVVTGEAGSSIDNLAEVMASDQDDPDGANDTAVEGVRVERAPSPEPTQTVEPPAAIAFTGGTPGRLFLLMVLFVLLGMIALFVARRLESDGHAP